VGDGPSGQGRQKKGGYKRESRTRNHHTTAEESNTRSDEKGKGTGMPFRSPIRHKCGKIPLVSKLKTSMGTDEE